MFTHNGLTMRPVEAGDLEQMRQLRNDPSTWPTLGSIDHISEEQQRAWFDRLCADKTRAYFVVYEGDAFIGTIRMDERDTINRSVRVGADVVPAKRGKGYGTRIYRMLLKWCFDLWNCRRVWLLVMDTNGAGMHLYKKVGFKYEGTMREAIYRDGMYVDYHIMGILESEYRNG